MKVTRSLLAACARFIAPWEGFVGHVYRDAVGVPTIGFGHTGPDVWRIGHLTYAQGLALLARDLIRYAAIVHQLVHVRLGRGFAVALVSLVYNCGAAPLYGTVGRLLNAGDRRGAADAMLAWDHAGGRVLEGLRRRRLAERATALHDLAPRPVSRLLRRRRELAKRRAQLRAATAAGTRHYLRRRIHELRAAINHEKARKP